MSHDPLILTPYNPTASLSLQVLLHRSFPLPCLAHFFNHQQSNVKHFCRICKKGFLCGRALGGHMRGHGMGDDSTTIDDDDQASDWEDKLGGEVPSSKRRMYALRTNPNRSKSCRVCENCGKEFSSWKSFLEHGKCSSEDAESLVSSPASSDGEFGICPRASGWSKRKRSFRAQVGHFNSNCPSSEEEDLAANCLMMLSNAAVVERSPTMAQPEESCASASKDEERRIPLNFISSVSCKIPTDYNKAKGVSKTGLFECKACKKVFNSHQALGGHRASHKKVKGCFAAKLDQIEDTFPEDDVISHEEFFPTKPNSTTGRGSNAPLTFTSKRKSKVHECSICHRKFSSGQALGGHKRFHWVTSNAPDKSAVARFQQIQEKLEHLSQIPKFDSDSLDLNLDLNLPAPGDHELAGSRRNVTTEIFLQSWGERKEADEDDYHHQNDGEITNNKSNNTSVQNVDDEEDSTVKLAKLSELKDMKLGGNSTAWLQVGISSADDMGTET